MVSSGAHYPKQNIIFLRPDVKFSKKEYALHTGLFWFQKVEYLEKTKHTVKIKKKNFRWFSIHILDDLPK